ncbi:MAG: hypothetical protein RIR88_149 [Actinomycetota bacterium]
MSTVHAVATRPTRFSTDEFFGQQTTARAELPDPTPLVENLSRSVLEILAGARELDQIARWVTDDVYRHLLQRVHVSRRARAIKKQPVTRPHFTLGRTIITEPADGVVEAVVIVHGRARSRSIAVRLEGIDRRWRATAIHVL